MMNRLASVLLVLAFAGAAQAQNLIPNPSFEIHTGCPGGSDIHLAPPWIQPTVATPDYYHVCGAPQSDVPNNWQGSQFANTGDAYGGAMAYFDVGNSYREYIETPLLQTLDQHCVYRASAWISLSELSGYGIDGFGFYFSPTSLVLTNTIDNLPHQPQVENASGNYLDDMTNWMFVSGTFLAQGNETHVILGNFRDNAGTGAVVASGPNNFAYLYIDDVTVEKAASDCVAPPAGLTSWWPFDETSGAIAHDIEGSNPGAWINGPVPNSGIVDGALYTSSLLGYVSAPSSPTLNVGTADFSLDAWIFVEQLVDGPIAAKMEDPDAGNGYAFYLTQNGNIGLAMRDNSGLHTWESIDTVAQAGWTFVAVTVDRDSPTGGRLFVNDQVTVFDPSAAQGDLDNDEPFHMGYQTPATTNVPFDGYFEGVLDELELFGVAVPSDDMIALYEAGCYGKCKPEIANPIPDWENGPVKKGPSPGPWGPFIQM